MVEVTGPKELGRDVHGSASNESGQGPRLPSQVKFRVFMVRKFFR